MARTPPSFVPLTSLRAGAPDPAAALAEIRRIYFATTRLTIEQDLAHAISLLMSIPEEDDREKASVYMEGLAEMRREWDAAARKKRPAARSRQPSKAAPKPGKRR